MTFAASFRAGKVGTVQFGGIWIELRRTLRTISSDTQVGSGVIESPVPAMAVGHGSPGIRCGAWPLALRR